MGTKALVRGSSTGGFGIRLFVKFVAVYRNDSVNFFSGNGVVGADVGEWIRLYLDTPPDPFEI